MNSVFSRLSNVVRIHSLLVPLIQQAMPYYAVAAGFKIGIFDTWSACEVQVKGYSNPKYKKFKSRQEAEEFLRNHGVNLNSLDRPAYDDEPVALPRRLGTPKKSSFSDFMKTATSPSKAPMYLQEQKVEEPEIEDNWPDDVECNDDDESLLLAAAEEVEGISESSRKRKTTSLVSDASSSKVLKKYQHDSKIWEPIGLKKIGNFEFPIDSEGYVIVYTDGSCINNGQPDAVAGLGVYFSEGHALNAAKPVNGRVTNNAGEIQAAIHAIQIAKDFGIQKLCLSTDSQFLINAVTAWIKGWKRNGWKLRSGEPVKNVDDFIILEKLLDGSVHIKWNYVKGHKGIVGNEKADRLARKGADLYREMMRK